LLPTKDESAQGLPAKAKNCTEKKRFLQGQKPAGGEKGVFFSTTRFFPSLSGTIKHPRLLLLFCSISG